MYGDIINTDLCVILSCHVDTSFSSIDHKLYTFDTDDPVRKVANYEDHASGNYKASLLHMPVIDPIDHCTEVPCPFKLSRVIQLYWSLHRAQPIQRGIFNCGVHSDCNLHDLRHFSYIGVKRGKCMVSGGKWDDKIPQTHVSITFIIQ